MASRLEKLISASPRRAVALVITLAVALLVVSIGFFAYASDIDVFGAPYPSEVTMLSLTDDGVKWTMSYSLVFGDSMFGCLYENIRFHWGHEMENGYSAFGGPVIDETDQNDLFNIHNATVEHWIGSSGIEGWSDYEPYFLVVTDVEGDGWFGINDSIVFKINSTRDDVIPEDRVYTVALAYVDGSRTVGFGEFSYAMHGGKFYSWTSDTLNWDRPWWEY